MISWDAVNVHEEVSLALGANRDEFGRLIRASVCQLPRVISFDLEPHPIDIVAPRCMNTRSLQTRENFRDCQEQEKVQILVEVY